jgi:hypothetical protein
MNHEVFRPRRLGRANLYAWDLERPVDFYSRVCEVQLKHSVVIEDPDGVMVDLYAWNTTTLPLPDTQRSGATRTSWFVA